MSNCELDNKTPNWFKLWANNHFWHLKFKVDLLMWAVGAILAGVIGTAIKIYFFSQVGGKMAEDRPTPWEAHCLVDKLNKEGLAAAIAVMKALLKKQPSTDAFS